MTRVLREFARPNISVRPADHGLQIFALREIGGGSVHVRVTNLLFPQAFVIPLSAQMTITQWHVPIDELQLLLVCVVHQLHATRRQARDASPAPGALHPCPTTSRE